jgi:hypothetical protein
MPWQLVSLTARLVQLSLSLFQWSIECHGGVATPEPLQTEVGYGAIGLPRQSEVRSRGTRGSAGTLLSGEARSGAR